MPGSVPGFALITAPVGLLTFLFTGRDAAITMNSVKNRNHHAEMSF